MRMKTKTSKRAWSLFLALALVVTTVFGGAVTAKADTTTPRKTLVEEAGEAAAGVETTRYNFTVEKAGKTDIGILLPSNIGLTINLYKGDTIYDSYAIASTDPYWTFFAEFSAYDNGKTYESLPEGDYSVGYVFESDTQYMAYVDSYVADPKISDEKATITVGFTKKLSVENGTVKSWSSKDKKIAAVDTKGKITAKKKGKTTITATLTDGTKLKCTVTVKDNKYSASKITSNDVYYGDCAMSAYSASFDKNGNLVIKARFVNNTSYKVTKLTDIKVTVKDGDGKTVGTFKQKSKSFTVAARNSKDVTFTIKKSSLKMKKADLRNCTITCDGGYYYVY